MPFDAVTYAAIAAIAKGANHTITDVPVASFLDGAAKPLKELVIDIDPVQDLHGYSSPWPAGGGKNLFDKATAPIINAYIGATIVSSDSHRMSYIPCKPNTTYTLQKVCQNASDRLGICWTKETPANNVACYDADALNSGTVGNVISVTTTTGADAAYIALWLGTATTVSLDTTQVEVGSAATDYAPCSNICPISGWTGCNLAHTGKNIFGGLALGQGIAGGFTSAVLNTTTKTVSFNSATAENDVISNLPKFKENTQYTIILNGKVNAAIWYWNLAVKYTDGTTKVLEKGNVANQEYTTAFTTAAGKTVSQIYCIRQSAAYTYLNYENCGIFEGTLTVDDFVPYTGSTIPISWQDDAGTVYAAEHDVLAGLLTVKNSIYTFDGTETWVAQQSGYRASVPGLGAFDLPTVQTVPNAICSVLQPVSISSIFSSAVPFSFSVSEDGIFIDAETYADTSILTGQSIVYELATPVAYQLTGAQVETLLGDNALWVDCGNINTLTYRADTGVLDYPFAVAAAVIRGKRREA
jgi:hypothetical protein